MNTKSAFVAIVGRPNVGKSSLLNRFIGEKVAIVTPKPQTTRTRITGVLTLEQTQIVFIDTPGIHRPKTKLSEYMVQQVKQSVSDVELAILVTEPTGLIHSTELELLKTLQARKIPAILVINKIDTLAHKDMMMQKIRLFSEQFDFAHVIPASVINNDGVAEILAAAVTFAKDGPHYFDKDDYTDQPERVIVSEILREKLLQNMRDEIPHGVAVGIEQMKEREVGGMIDIQAIIYCEKESHKGMIIGKNGAMLKRISTAARIDIENFLDCKINLQTWVKVKDDWRNRPGMLKEFGFRQ